ncbi:hypothetical protein ACWCQP_37125 [Streptomyces chartreusis]
MLALAQLDVDYRNWHSHQHWANPPELEVMLPSGPWPLLWQADLRDPLNREAYHRMLQCFQARGHGAKDFTFWASSRAPAGSSHLVLPLFAHVEDYRMRLAGGQVAGTLGYWSNEQIRHQVERARDGWFAYCTDTNACSLLDLNYLAYTLTACDLRGAAEVFTAIGPYATPAPWKHVCEGRWWQDDFAKARNTALKRAGYRH